MSYDVKCDPSATGEPDINIDDSDPCHVLVNFSHKTGCPVFESSDLVNWLAAHSKIVGAILIVYGFFSTFFGSKFYPYILGTFTGALTFFLVLFFASLFGGLRSVQKDSDATAGEITATVASFVIALVLAFAVGTFLKKH